MAIGTTAAISAGISLASAGAGFAQASKQNRLMREAQEAAAKYMEEAKKTIGVNYMEDLQVPLEGYEAAARQNLAQSMQATEALRESGQRALLGGTGKVQAQGAEFADDLRFQMQKDLYDRDKMIAFENRRIAGDLADIDLAEARGAQVAAAQADENRARSIEGAFGSLTNAGLTAFQGTNLYSMSPADKMGQAIGPIGGLDEQSVGRIANSQDLNFFQRRSLMRRGQGSRFFDLDAFNYFDPQSVSTVAPRVNPFDFSFPNPYNPFE